MSLRLCSLLLALATGLAAGCSGGDETAGEDDHRESTDRRLEDHVARSQGERGNRGCAPCRSSTARTGYRPASTSVPPGTRRVLPRRATPLPGAQAASRKRPFASSSARSARLLTKLGQSGLGESSERRTTRSFIVPLSDFVSGVDVGQSHLPGDVAKHRTGGPGPGDVGPVHGHLGEVAGSVRASRTRRVLSRQAPRLVGRRRRRGSRSPTTAGHALTPAIRTPRTAASSRAVPGTSWDTDPG